MINSLELNYNLLIYSSCVAPAVLRVYYPFPLVRLITKTSYKDLILAKAESIQ